MTLADSVDNCRMKGSRAPGASDRELVAARDGFNDNVFPLGAVFHHGRDGTLDEWGDDLFIPPASEAAIQRSMSICDPRVGLLYRLCSS
jgi:hypothetical protein